MSAFEDLLRDLGDKWATTLRPDHHNCCRLVFSDGLALQIDLNSNGDKILCAYNLGNVPPGAFRERVFKQALIFNGLQTKKGVLAFSSKNDELILFQYFLLSSITGEKLHKFLLSQVEHARMWIEALRSGQLPTSEEMGVPSKSGYLGLQ